MAGSQLKKSALALETYVNHHLMFQRLEDIRTVNTVIVQFESLLGRLIHKASVLAHSNQLQPPSASRRVDVDGCGDIVLSRSGTPISDEISLLLTQMMSASRIISLKV